jgi:hypothetical protein
VRLSLITFSDARAPYYLYDVPSGATRGGHAHKTSEAVIIALSRSFEVILDDGAAMHIETT